MSRVHLRFHHCPALCPVASARAVTERPRMTLSQMLITSGLATPAELEGCTDAEIAQLNEAAGWPLPDDYLDIMRAIGRRSGQFLAGSDFHFPRVCVLKTWANEALRANGSPREIGDDEFVFSMHGGYHFCVLKKGRLGIGECGMGEREVRWTDRSVEEFFGEAARAQAHLGPQRVR